MIRVAFLTSRFPYPLNKGDKLRAFNQIKTLGEDRNFEVHLISISETPPSTNDINELKKYCKSINNFFLPKYKRKLNLVKTIFTKTPFSVDYFYSSKINLRINSLIKELNINFIHCHLIRTSKYISKQSKTPNSIDFMDCFSIGAEKELGYSKSWIKRQFLKSERKRLINFESKEYDKFQIRYIISNPDKDAFPISNNNIDILANGVDFSIFQPNKTKKQYDLLFSGHMGYIPNISAAEYTIKSIMPLLNEEVNLLVGGIGISKELKKEAKDNIVLKEIFPHIREAFWQSKILIAPMNISIGLQNKILQAMAMKIPVVCSKEANGSVGGTHNKNIVLANNPKEYKLAIDRLLSDTEFYNKISENSYEFVNTNFSWEVVNEKMKKNILNFE